MPVIDGAAVLYRAWIIAKQVAYGLVLATFFIIIAAMFVAFVKAFFIFYDAIDSFITNINNYGSGDLLSKFFGLLSCMGFSQALNDTKAMIASSLVFLLARIVFAQMIYAWFIVLRVISPLLK